MADQFEELSEARQGSLRNWIGWSFLVGTICVVVLCFAIPYNAYYLRGPALGQGHLPFGAIFVLVIFALGINAGLRAINRRWAFSPGELLVIWAMILGAIMTLTLGVSGAFPHVLAGVIFYASAANHWAEKFHAYIPEYLVPSTDAKSAVLNYFWSGLGVDESVPWMLWIRPLAWWGLLLVLLLVVFACLSVIFRKQWTDRERLPFPLVRLPLAIVSGPGSGKLVNDFFRDRLMWIGFFLSAGVYGFNELSKFYPTIPPIPLRFPLYAQFSERPYDMMHFSNIELDLAVVGITYILPIQVAFSLWFFFILARLELLTAGILGFRRTPVREPFMVFQEAGAVLCFFAFMVWLSRQHLAGVVRRAVGASNSADDSDEPFSYRLAFWGMVLGVIGIVLWCTFIARMNPLWSFLSWAFFIITMIVLSKVVAQGGILVLQKSYASHELLGQAFGPMTLGAQTLTMMTVQDWTIQLAYSSVRDSALPHFLNLYKFSDGVRASRRVVLVAFLLAFVIASVLGFFTQISAANEFGAGQIQGFQRLPTRTAGEIIQAMNQGRTIQWRRLIFFGTGALAMLGLYVMQSRFYWWPLHPIGFLGMDSFAQNGFFSILLSWFLKKAILSYGGGRAYRRLMGPFLGLVLGQAFVYGIVIVVRYALNSPLIE